MNRDFLWGGALSNVQAEGAYLEDGKGLNVYDTLKVTPEPGIAPLFCDTSVAVDHYHRYKEDVRIMKEIGLKGYRFSIDWSRVMPEGAGRVNEAGIAFYNDLIDELLKNDIEP